MITILLIFFFLVFGILIGYNWGKEVEQRKVVYLESELKFYKEIHKNDVDKYFKIENKQ